MMKMKKKLLALLVLGACVLAFTACGGDKKSAAEPSAPAETEVSAEPETESSGSDELDASDLLIKKVSVEEFVQSDDIQSQVASVKESMPEGWNVEFLAEGDALVYLYTSPDQFEGAQIDALKTSLDEQFTDEYTGSLCDPVIKIMEQMTTAQNPAVVIRYANPDGSVVWEKTYDPE